MSEYARGDRRSVYARRRFGLVLAALLIVAAGAYLGTRIGGSGDGTTTTRTLSAAGGGRASSPTTSLPVAVPRPPPPPRLVVSSPGQPSGRWTLVARVHGRPAAWIAQRSGVTLMRFDQALVHLTLHAGSSDGGAVGWRYGDQITPREVHLVVAAFNGGFKLTYKDVGFTSGAHVAVPLSAGLASIVTYTDGSTDIGAWRAGVPSAGKTVYSVLQNQQLLVDRGVAAPTVFGCVIACWGETIGSRTVVARSGLGINPAGQLVWAAGEELTPAGLAHALIAAGAARAIELDINPAWVAGYLYVHRSSGPEAVPVVPGQNGLAGQLLAPYSRDFLAVIAN